MKFTLLLLLMILNHLSYSQREPRFIDSLTLDHHRSWAEVGGAQFTELGDDCNFGMEMTFYKEDNKVEVFECIKGEWKVIKYRYEVVTEGREHYIKFYKKKKYLLFFNKEIEIDDFRVEVQMISDVRNKYSTEINYYGLYNKTTRTLRSKD